MANNFARPENVTVLELENLRAELFLDPTPPNEWCIFIYEGRKLLRLTRISGSEEFALGVAYGLMLKGTREQ